MTTEPHIYKSSLKDHMPFFEGKGVWKLASHLTMKQSVHMTQILYCDWSGPHCTVQRNKLLLLFGERKGVASETT